MQLKAPQPGDPRIKLRAQLLLMSAPMARPWLVSGSATTDAISGASAAYHSSILGPMQDRQTLLARRSHHRDSAGSTARWSWRNCSDNCGVHAHTLGLERVQPLADGWTITPLARLYTRSAARSYMPAGEADSPLAPNPSADAVYTTEDQRLSAYGGRTWGLKLARLWASGRQDDIKFERYAQRSAWRLFGSGSTGLTPFRARSLQLGVSHPF